MEEIAPEMVSSTEEDSEFYYNQFLVFPKVLRTIPRESFYDIVATRKDNGERLGSSAPYFSSYPEQEKQYVRMSIALVSNISLTKPLEEDEIKWTVQGPLPRELVVIEKPYLKTIKVKKYPLDLEHL
jgi:hypothetical protein